MSKKKKSADALLPLGKNLPLYLEKQGHDEQRAAQLLEAANVLARERGSRIIRTEFVMVAEGLITADALPPVTKGAYRHDLGDPKIRQMHAAMHRERKAKLAGKRPTAAAATAVARPRQPRRKLEPQDD